MMIGAIAIRSWNSWNRLVNCALLGRSMEQYAILLVRVSTGLFFAISAANKLFIVGDTKPVDDSLVKSKIPFPHLMAHFVSGVECVGGNSLAVGFCQARPAWPYATAVSTMPKGLSPLNWLDDFLNLPDVLYVPFFIWLLCSGPGKIGVGYWLAGKLLR